MMELGHQVQIFRLLNYCVSLLDRNFAPSASYSPRWTERSLTILLAQVSLNKPGWQTGILRDSFSQIHNLPSLFMWFNTSAGKGTSSPSLLYLISSTSPVLFLANLCGQDQISIFYKLQEKYYFCNGLNYSSWYVQWNKFEHFFVFNWLSSMLLLSYCKCHSV